MTFKLPAVLGVFLVVALPAYAQHGGGGGHGGFGGGGHSIGGHSVGHSIGHSVGHLFGSRSSGHGKGSGAGRAALEEPPIAGAMMIHGHVVQLPGPGQRDIHPLTPHRPLTEFGFRQRHHGFFGFVDFGFCSPFDAFFSDYAYGTGFGCASPDFFFDPFYGSGYSPDFDAMQWSEGDADAASQQLTDPQEFHADVILQDEVQPPVAVASDKVPHHRRSPNEPDTILQLKNGSMYGLRDYWIMDERLYYVTNYGGQNSVLLSQIDFEKSSELNADRGGKLALP